MTAKQNYSRGTLHSQKIKSSPNWIEWQRSRRRISRFIQPESKLEAIEASRLAEMAVLRAREFLSTSYRNLLSSTYREGYIQALRDVKEQREKDEVVSYLAAMPKSLNGQIFSQDAKPDDDEGDDQPDETPDEFPTLKL